MCAACTCASPWKGSGELSFVLSVEKTCPSSGGLSVYALDTGHCHCTMPTCSAHGHDARTESMVTGLFMGGVPVRCVASEGTSTSPGTSEPRALDFLFRLGMPMGVRLRDGDAPAFNWPFNWGNGSVMMNGQNSCRRDDRGTRHAGL